MDLIKIFEKYHKGHTLITVNYEEIKGQYDIYQVGDSQET